MACAHHGVDSLCGTDCPGYLYPSRPRAPRRPRPEVIDPPAPVTDEPGQSYPEHASGDDKSERVGE